MRRALLTVLASVTLAALTPSVGVAQSSIVDLSKPQTGKSEFVLNADFSAANLGAARKDAETPKVPTSATSDWCANGCRMVSPEAAATAQPGQRNATTGRSGVVVVSSSTRKDATEAAASKRSSSGVRVGRRR